MLVLIKFECGYHGCEEYVVVSSTCHNINEFEESEKYTLDDLMTNYEDGYEYLAEEEYENELEDEDEEDEWGRQAYIEDFRDNCYFTLKEVTLEEALNYVHSKDEIEEW